MSTNSEATSAATEQAEDLLLYRDRVFINFKNNTFQWVDIKRFQLPGTPCGDRTALGLLLRHVRYRDSYAGSADEDSGNLHGSYWLHNITIDSFTSVDATTEVHTLRAWAERYASLPDTARDGLERDLYPLIQDATSLYRLKGLGREAFHDWGGVHTEFHELVLINRTAGTLALVVASDD
jgi:hypothetical protein